MEIYSLDSSPDRPIEDGQKVFVSVLACHESGAPSGRAASGSSKREAGQADGPNPNWRKDQSFIFVAEADAARRTLALIVTGHALEAGTTHLHCLQGAQAFSTCRRCCSQ